MDLDLYVWIWMGWCKKKSMFLKHEAYILRSEIISTYKVYLQVQWKQYYARLRFVNTGLFELRGLGILLISAS